MERSRSHGYALGIIAEITFASTTWFQGPVAMAMAGADIAPFVGLAVGLAAYLLAYRGYEVDTPNLNEADVAQARS